MKTQRLSTTSIPRLHQISLCIKSLNSKVFHSSTGPPGKQKCRQSIFPNTKPGWASLRCMLKSRTSKTRILGSTARAASRQMSSNFWKSPQLYHMGPSWCVLTLTSEPFRLALHPVLPEKVPFRQLGDPGTFER